MTFTQLLLKRENGSVEEAITMALAASKFRIMRRTLNRAAEKGLLESWLVGEKSRLTTASAVEAWQKDHPTQGRPRKDLENSTHVGTISQEV